MVSKHWKFKEYKAAWYLQNIERERLNNRKRHYLRKYGISFEEYEEQLKLQDNVCYICKQPETAIDFRSKKPKNFAVDHCHATNKVRKLLCMRCNHVLGASEDSVELLQKYIDYLKEHN